MDNSKTFEYRPFDFGDTDPYIEICYKISYERLGKMYPNKTLFSSDCFVISIIDDKLDCCTEIASHATGRIGKIGTLAMKNESIKEVFALCQD